MQDRIRMMKERGQARLNKIQHSEISQSARPDVSPSEQPVEVQSSVISNQAPAAEPSPSLSQNEVELRRQRALEAARRRLSSSPSW